jgi:hypothetical protein
MSSETSFYAIAGLQISRHKKGEIAREHEGTKSLAGNFKCFIEFTFASRRNCAFVVGGSGYLPKSQSWADHWFQKRNRASRQQTVQRSVPYSYAGLPR